MSPLAAVAMTSSGAWAVGAAILHWSGAAWQPIYTVNGQPFGYLTGVTAAASGGLWAVGGSAIVHAACA